MKDITVVADLPHSERSDKEVLKAIEIEIRGIQRAQDAIDEATAQVNGSKAEGGAAKTSHPPTLQPTPNSTN
jgi:hypothetical protein